MNMRYKYCPFYNSMVLELMHLIEPEKSIFQTQNTFNKLFISLFWGLCCYVRLSLAVVTRELLFSCGVYGLLIVVTSVLEQALDTWASVLVEHGLGCSLACGISQTRDGTHVPCLSRQILSPWTIGEVLINDFSLSLKHCTQTYYLLLHSISSLRKKYASIFRDKFVDIMNQGWNLTWIVSLI